MTLSVIKEPMSLIESDKKQDDIVSAVRVFSSQNQDVDVVWLYGSRANGNAHSESDYDLAIAFNNFQLSDFDKYTRPHELALDWSERLKVATNKISIVDINQVPIYLAYNIVDSGMILYQEPNSRVFHETDRIYSMYEYQKREAMNG